MMRDLLQGSLDRAPDERGAERHVLRLSAAIGSRPESEATVHNLSRSGLLVACDAPLAKGEEITVEFASGTRHLAEVVWTDDGLCGCRFAQPLTRGEISAALLRALPGEPSPITAVPVEPARVSISDLGALTPGAKAWIIIGAALLSWACLASLASLAVLAVD